MADTKKEGVETIIYKDKDGDIQIEHEYYDEFYTVEDIIRDYEQSGYVVLEHKNWA